MHWESKSGWAIKEQKVKDLHMETERKLKHSVGNMNGLKNIKKRRKQNGI